MPQRLALRNFAANTAITHLQSTLSGCRQEPDALMFQSHESCQQFGYGLLIIGGSAGIQASLEHFRRPA